MRSFCLMIILVAGAGWAEEPMTGDDFDAYATGRTITFRSDDTPLYGVERYLPDRRVMWSTFEGICRYGVWFESDGDICFRYDHSDTDQCWVMVDTRNGLRAEYTTVPDTIVIYEIPNREDPLICNDLSS